MTMAHSSSDDSPTSSCSSSRMSDETTEDTADDGFWNGLARRAKTVLDDSPLDSKAKDPRQSQRKLSSESLILQNRSSRHLSDSKWKRQESLVLHKGLEAIASSLSLLSDTLGNALEEGLNLVEAKATNFIHTEPRNKSLKKSLGTQKLFTSSPEPKANREEKSTHKLLTGSPEPKENSTQKLLTGSPEPKANREEKPTLKVLTGFPEPKANREDKPPRDEAYSQEKLSGLTKDTQLKASRDVAMAMATKAKLLLRELKGVKTDLAFTKARCTQLEEENKRLRESMDKGVRHEEDDLVRLQLEALLAEKARLMQENAAYARENQFLHEVVQYHQLKLRNIGFLDESLVMMEDEGSLGTSAMDMDSLPLYPEEKDIIALEESVKIASQPAMID